MSTFLIGYIDSLLEIRFHKADNLSKQNRNFLLKRFFLSKIAEKNRNTNCHGLSEITKRYIQQISIKFTE